MYNCIVCCKLVHKHNYYQLEMGVVFQMDTAILF